MSEIDFREDELRGLFPMLDSRLVSDIWTAYNGNVMQCFEECAKSEMDIQTPRVQQDDAQHKKESMMDLNITKQQYNNNNNNNNSVQQRFSYLNKRRISSSDSSISTNSSKVKALIDDISITEQNHNILHKVTFILLGMSGVGKSSLMHRFTDNNFKDSIQSTISPVEYGRRTVDVDGQNIRVLIQDTVGLERGGCISIPKMYYRNADGVLLVYDTTRKETLECLAEYLFELRQYAKIGIQTVLIGNKADLLDIQTVTMDDAVEFAKINSLQWMFRTSAKSGSGVEDAFLHLARYVCRRQEADTRIRQTLQDEDKSVNGVHIVLDENEQQKSSKCC